MSTLTFMVRVRLTGVLAALCSCLLIASMPAHAEHRSRVTIQFNATLPASIVVRSDAVQLPGNVVFNKKVRNDNSGQIALSKLVALLKKRVDQGRSVGGAINMNGTLWLVKGLPVLLDNGDVKVRVERVLGSRTLLVPRSSGSTYNVAVCGYGMVINPLWPSPQVSPQCVPQTSP